MAMAGGGNSLKLIGGLLCAAVLLALGSAVYFARQPEPTTRAADAPKEQNVAARPTGAQPQDTVATEQGSAPDAATETETEASEGAPQDSTTAEADENAETGPAFDVVRVEPDGAALVAGTGAAGSKVTIFVDDVAQDPLPVDDGGKFVGFLSLQPGDNPRVLTLSSEIDGKTIRSDDQVILAPAPQTGTERLAVAGKTEHKTAPENPAVAGTADAAGDDSPVAESPGREDGADSGPSDLADRAIALDGAAVGGSPVQPDTLPDGSAAGAAPAASDPAPTTAATPRPAPVTVLRSTAEGIELLRTDAAGPQDRITLDIIGYSQAGSVQLAGRSGAGAQVRIYLDNRPITDLRADPAGRWQVQLDDVVAGVYTLRLDELGQGGDVVSRLETPFQRATAAALDAAGTGQSDSTAPVRAVTVQTGDTLWAISRDRYGEGLLYVRVFEANRDAIRDPDLIYPGQVFAIPD